MIFLNSIGIIVFSKMHLDNWNKKFLKKYWNEILFLYVVAAVLDFRVKWLLVKNLLDAINKNLLISNSNCIDDVQEFLLEMHSIYKNKYERRHKLQNLK